MWHAESSEVVVAGTGVSASALALLLLRHGFRVSLLHRADRSAGPVVIEAMSQQAARLFQEVGLGQALADAGAVAVEGFENAWHPEQPRRLEGWRVHVDRAALARSALALAVSAGAALVPITAVPPPEPDDRAGVRVSISGHPLLAFAAVNATGRSAAWSRPVACDKLETAALYVGPGRKSRQSGRVVKLRSGWAYRIAHPTATTVGWVRDHGAGPDVLDSQVADALDVPDWRSFVRVAHRTSSVQWSQHPVRQRSLAVGDAALAYSPVAGDGLRFAVASALAATSVLTTWRDGDVELASEYYRIFVVSAHQRHSAALKEFHSGPSRPSDPTTLRSTPWETKHRVRFTAAECVTGVNRANRIVPDVAFVLPDGGLVRWAGTFDLMALRDLAGIPQFLGDLRQGLVDQGLSPADADRLLYWCIDRRILS